MPGAQVGLLLVLPFIIVGIIGALMPPVPSAVRNFSGYGFGMFMVGGFMAFYIMPVFSLAGVVLGVIGVLQKDRRKTLGYVGLAVNGLILAGLLAVLVPSLPVLWEMLALIHK